MLQLLPKEAPVRSLKLATLALTMLVGFSQSGLPVLALSSADVVYAINKRQFLPAGTALNVRIDKDQVFVSTFRHANAEAKDCKIDAVLIGRAVLDVAPDEVARVTTYFYGIDMSSYQEVSVTAGDVKAFASGQTDKDQLLAALAVRTNKTASELDSVSQQLENNSIPRPGDYKIVQDKPDSISVTTAMDPWVSDEEARLEALRIATSTFQAQPRTETVKVIFTDPSFTAESREFDFITSRLDAMWKAIHNAVGSVTVLKKPGSIEALRTVKGCEQEARDNLLAQLKDMDRRGIGIAPFVRAFLFIEQSVRREVDPKYIVESVSRLKASMDDQMKAYAAAREKKPAKNAVVEQPKAPAQPAGRAPSRWVTGESPIIEGEVLANPDLLVAQYEQRLGAGFKRPEDNPSFVLMLDQVAGILVKNNRSGEAVKYQQRAAQIRASQKKRK
jgi:hypothetical protein